MFSKKGCVLCTNPYFHYKDEHVLEKACGMNCFFFIQEILYAQKQKINK